MEYKTEKHNWMPFNWTLDGKPDYSTLPSPRLYPEPFEFEKHIQWRWWIDFMSDYWYLPLIASVIYLITIFGIQHLMKERKPFNLKRELFIWNASLGIFSIAAFVRLAPEFIAELYGDDGFYKIMCSPGYAQSGIFWGILYVLSKYVELGDTVFITLRKKPLVVLQWYHHSVTLIGCWLSVPYLEPVNRTLIVTNLGVHSFMYPYFAAKTLNFNVPKKLAHLITTMQFSQMLISGVFQSYSAYLYSQGSCYRHPFMMTYVMVVNVTFIYLFGNLFYKSVLRNKIREGQKKLE